MIIEFKNRQIQLVFALAISMQLITPALCAQYDFQKVKEQQKKHVDLMKNYHTIKEPVSFPDLPLFNGRSKFIFGNYSPNQNGITSCSMQFASEETPQTILAFYKDALATNKWKIQYAGAHGISARHDKGHMCNINVNASKEPKIKCLYTIDYRQIEQQHP